MTAIEFGVAEAMILHQGLDGLAEMGTLGAGDETAPVPQLGQPGAESFESGMSLAQASLRQRLGLLAESLMESACALEGALVEQFLEAIEVVAEAGEPCLQVAFVLLGRESVSSPLQQRRGRQVRWPAACLDQAGQALFVTLLEGLLNGAARSSRRTRAWTIWS
ncbi:hypothetical protein [Halomonas organivorans]|uniref:hypothetical protein n=1 Tax=Halomonas organivorans TaxID=257772 RepID=UPI003624EDCD